MNFTNFRLFCQIAIRRPVYDPTSWGLGTALVEPEAQSQSRLVNVGIGRAGRVASEAQSTQRRLGCLELGVALKYFFWSGFRKIH